MCKPCTYGCLLDLLPDMDRSPAAGRRAAGSTGIRRGFLGGMIRERHSQTGSHRP